MSISSDFLLYFWATVGPLKRRGARGSLPLNPPFRRAWYGFSRLFKVIDFGGNPKRICDFLLVINSNIDPISHRFWDTASY